MKKLLPNYEKDKSVISSDCIIEIFDSRTQIVMTTLNVHACLIQQICVNNSIVFLKII